MMNTMEQCWQWMLSLGWAGMFMGVVLLTALVVLAVMGIVRLARASDPR